MEERKSFRVFLILTIILGMILFSYIELRSPYNFLKDDNFAQFLPVLIEGSQQLFSGNLPLINFHQLMGSKILETGTYAVLYPPMMVSYFLAHYVFKNDFILLEIFAFLHILSAAVVTYMYLRKYSKTYWINFMAAIAVSFSGYSLIAGSNWYYVLPSILFVPLLLYMSDKIYETPSMRKALLLGAIRGAYFYSGNAQYFAYAVFFEVLYFILLNGRRSWKESKKSVGFFILSYALTMIIALPLLFSQLSSVRDSPRGNQNSINYLISLSSSPREAVLGSIFVYPLVKSYNSFAYSNGSFTHIYYTGTLFALLFIVQGIVIAGRILRRKKVETNPCFWIGIVAFLLSLGVVGLIYIPGAFLPVIKSFSYSFKVTLFTNIFVVLAGAVFSANILSKLKLNEGKNIYLSALTVALFLVLIFYHVSVSSNTAWSYYGDKMPLNTKSFENYSFDGKRVISVYTNSSHNPRLIKFSNSSYSFEESESLSQNFATYYNLDHIGGYEPFQDRLTSEKIPISRFGVADIRLNLTTLREYGVGYIFIQNESRKYHPELNELNVKIHKENLTVLDLNDSRGYVFSEEGNIMFNITEKGIDFKTNFKKEKNVTLNFLYKKNYRAYINGESTVIYKDYYGRMVVKFPEGPAYANLKYYPKELFLGLFLSIILLILLFFAYNKKELIFLPIGDFIEDRFEKIEKRHVKTIVLLIVLILILIFAVSFLTSLKGNIKDTFQQRIGTSIDFSSIGFNIFSGKFSFKDFKAYSKEGGYFESKEINLDASYSESIKNTLKSKSPILIFDKAVFKEVKINLSTYKNDSPVSCLNSLRIFSQNDLSNSELFSEEIVLERTSFVPFNRLYITNQSVNMQFREKNTSIYLNLSVSQYLQGDIIIGENRGKKEERCIKLPLDEKSNF